MSNRTIDLANEISKVLALGESGEIDEQTIKDTLEGIEGMLEDKFDAAMAVIRDFEANKKKCKEEAARLNERSKHWDRQAGQIKTYLLDCLKLAGRDSLKTTLNTFTARKGGISLTIVNEDDIPDEYLISSKSLVVNEFDKERIKKILTENLKAVEDLRQKGLEPTPEQLNMIPGAKVERGETTLSVR
ncbi:siphovirus Gp157 family protein [Enterobacter sp. WCHEn045836]|uniref:siphovirus Gp157 family protein n=1 Tax=Enterobacter sp. WCHEn045836 TaxID=2497434 RepID=UPI000F843B96|nr:siphovirus Gp157 family protein [Enterobacter sp. WCHEn045836]RTQ01263.1 siphovirus Gp157 family protein [Enterobacter sp. WCHEn045836]